MHSHLKAAFLSVSLGQNISKQRLGVIPRKINHSRIAIIPCGRCDALGLGHSSAPVSSIKLEGVWALQRKLNNDIATWASQFCQRALHARMGLLWKCLVLIKICINFSSAYVIAPSTKSMNS